MAGFDRVPGVDVDYKFPAPVRAAIAEDLVEKSADTFVVYARGASGDIVVPFSENPFENTLVHRHAGGAARVGTAVDDDDAMPKYQVEALVIPNFLILGPTDPIPGGTPADTVILRTAS